MNTEDPLGIRANGVDFGKLGWKREPEGSADGQCYAKGDKRLWKVADGRWACADLTGDGSSVSVKYRNHRYYDRLYDAVEKET